MLVDSWVAEYPNQMEEDSWVITVVQTMRPKLRVDATVERLGMNATNLPLNLAYVTVENAKGGLVVPFSQLQDFRCQLFDILKAAPRLTSHPR